MSIFANVFVGNTANDGTGTPLRNAFEIIDQNFANIAGGSAGAPVQSVAGRGGNVILTVNDVQGVASNVYVASLFNGYAYTNSNVANYLPTDSTIIAIQTSVNLANAAIVTANTGVVGYVNTLVTNLAGTIANTSNDHNNLNNAVTNITTLFSNAASQTVSINLINANVTAANAAIVTANSAVVSYVNAQDSLLQAEITAANVAIANVSSAWQANAAVLYADIQTNNTNEVTLGNYITAANAAIVTANSAVVSYVNNLVTPIQSNIVTLLNNANNLSGALTNITTLSTGVNLINANITAANLAIASLQSNAATQSAQIVAANAAIVTANTAVVSYINSLIAPIQANTANILTTDTNLAGALTNITTLTNDINLINANVSAANIAGINVASEITATNANVTAANLAIITANSAVVTYVNSLIAPIQANTANILATDATLVGALNNITTLAADVILINANVTAANAKIATQAGTITTLNTDVAALTANVTTGPFTISGNVRSANLIATNSVISTTGYFWANGAEYVTSMSSTGNITFVGDNISSVDNSGGINFYSNGKIHIESLTGFDSSNPAYWVDIGNLQNVNTGNLGINFSNAGSFANTTVATYDWWDGIGSGQTNNSSTKHATFGLYRGDGVPGNGQTRAYITFDTGSAAATAPIAVQANSAVITNGDNITVGNIYTLGGHLRTTAPIANVFNSTNTLYMGIGANVILLGNVNSTVTTQGNLAVTGNVISNNYQFANGVNILSTVTSNTATVSASLQTLQANVGAFELYANTNISTNTTNIQTLNANVGAYEIATNANLGTATTNIATLFSNAATQTTQINAVNANVTAANTAIVTLQTQTYSNANVAAYLPTYAGNVTAGNVISNNHLFANGVNILSTVTASSSISSGSSSIGFQGAGGNILLDVGGVQVATVTQTQLTVLGNVTAANIGITGNTGFPTNTATIKGWARVTVGGTAYWTPLYQ